MKKRLVCLASLLLLLAVWAQSAAAEETAWRTQRYDLVGAEFSVVPPEGSYLLNENTRELLRNDREAADALMRLQGEDSIDRLCANGGNMVLDLEGYLRMLVEISSTDMDQSVLWMYEDAFCSAVGDEMENNGYTDIEFDWYMSPAGNQFFCAYGQGTSLGQTRTYSHIATADNNGHLVEIWTYGMERADIERVLDNIAAPVNQSADERTVSDAFRKNLLQSELFVWDDCLLFTENGQSVSIYGLSMGYDMPNSGELELPSSISGLPVVQIDAGAFSGISDIVRIRVPSSVQRIGSGAFEGMNDLMEVILEEGVLSIEDAFKGCSNLINVVIPPSVTTIAPDAFDTQNPCFHLTVEKGSYAAKYAAEHELPYVYAHEEKPVSLSAGNTVSFGEYGGEDIQWLVLEVENGEALLLAKDVITQSSFSAENDGKWAKSSIHRMLNEELLYEIFSMEEAGLLTARRINDPASPYSTFPISGSADFRPLFLLSYYEARDLLSSDEQRAASLDWWLRTSSDESGYAHYVTADGVLQAGAQIGSTLGIRPAVRIRTDRAGGVIKIVDDSVWIENPPEDDGVFGAGDIIQLGRYEQDNNNANGTEPIDWIALQVNGTTATLISRYCIDVQPYHSGDEAVNWGQTSLRNWLNGDFVTAAFNETEQFALIENAVESFDTDAAKNFKGYSHMLEPVVSYDRVWILDDSEAGYYFPAMENKLSYLTQYADARGGSSNIEGYGHWMLRTDKNEGCRVNIMLPYKGGASVDASRRDVSVRPVIMVDLVLLGIVDVQDQDYAEDWNNPYTTLTSQGKSNPEKGRIIPDYLLDKVLRIENRSGGWFRMTAPEDGDYSFTVLASDLEYSSFSMEISVNGQKRASLFFDRSDEQQTGFLKDVRKGDVIAWWDSDNSGKGNTMCSPYKLMISRYAPGTAPETPALGFITPLDGDEIPVGQKLTLEWTRIPGAACYSVYAYPESSLTVWDWAEFYTNGELTAEIPRSTLTDSGYRIELNAWRNDRFVGGEEIFSQTISISTYNKYEEAESDAGEAGETELQISGEYAYLPLEDGTVAFAGFTGQGALVIPETIDDYTVTAVADSACYWNSSLTSVTIPGTVRTIGAGAFSWCMSLKSVIISEGVESIGASAFSNNSSLESIEFPDSVAEIGESACSSCESLRSIRFPAGLTTIENSVCSNNSGLESIEFPDSVAEIGESVCSGCESLTSVKLPEQLTVLGESAFSDCSSLTEIVIPVGVRVIPESAFFFCTALKSVQLPEGLTEIGEMAFYCCENLTELVIPDSVTAIGEWAFASCTSLSGLTCPDTAVRGEGAFFDCPL